jgi:hypothetical protein
LQGTELKASGWLGFWCQGHENVVEPLVLSQCRPEMVGAITQRFILTSSPPIFID